MEKIKNKIIKKIKEIKLMIDQYHTPEPYPTTDA